MTLHSKPDRRHGLRILLAAFWSLSMLGCGVADDPPRESIADQRVPPTATDKRDPSALGADVILITLDTVRADSLGFAGHEGVRTPVLDLLAEQGRVYSEAFAHSVVTLPSHTNILTGLYPYQHGVRENSGFILDGSVETLATRLKAAGYSTGAFIGAYPLDSRFGLHRGFDVYDDSYTVGTGVHQFRFAERQGDQVVAAARAWWEQQEGGKRFAWLHIWDAHTPYEPPEPWATEFSEEPYLGEISAADSFLEPLLGPYLEGREKPAFIVVTSDHGEALGDHGEATHGLFAYNATLKIPLALWGPGVEIGRDESLVGHVDIVPTLLDAVGLGKVEELPGRSLLASPDEGRNLYFEALSTYFNRGWAPLRGLLSGRDKAISLPLPELYALDVDPMEEKNLLLEERARFHRLMELLPDEEAWPPGQRNVEPEEVARLRALGYIASSGESRSHFGREDDPKTLLPLDQRLHRMVNAYVHGQFGLAEQIARRIVAERPTMATGHEHLALALRGQRKLREALEVLQAAVAQGIASDAVLLQLGSILSEVGRPREAVEILRPLATEENSAARNVLAIAISALGGQEEALAMLGKVLEREPSNTETLENLGVVYLRMDRPREAIVHLEKAVSLAENVPTSWNTLGVARARMGGYPGAIEAWTRAVELDPGMLDALYNLGLTAAQIGDRERARWALESYVENAPPERFAADIQRARQILARLGV